jgi:2-keto-3-deoxy-L-rhamnonate aldolase RhmA
LQIPNAHSQSQSQSPKSYSYSADANSYPGPAVVRSLAGIPGFNWVLIDGEHGLISDGDYYEVSVDVCSADGAGVVG